MEYEEILKKIKINEPTFRSYISRIVALNITKISEPCYFPKLKGHYFEMLRMAGLNNQEIRNFTKMRWKGRKEERFAIHQEHIANFYVLLLQYFLRKRKVVSYKYMMYFFVIRYYTGILNRSFPKFCNEDVFKLALERIAKNHLFVREKTISNALQHISKDMIRLWTNGLQKNDLEQVSRFMQDSRTRISQSVKSFAEAYYQASEEGVGYKSDDETDDPELMSKPINTDNSNKLAELTTKKIVIYKQINHTAKEEARQLSKVKSTIATQVAMKLGNVKFSDDIRLIYKLFLVDLKMMKQLCSKEIVKYVNSKMSIRRTTQKIYFKQQINLLLVKVLKEFNYYSQYEKLTTQTKYLISLYLAFYLALYLKYEVCPN